MIRHLVLFAFTEKARQEGPEAVLEKLRKSAARMTGMIPGLLSAELNLNLANGSSHGLVYYSEFDTLQSLDAYQTHPLHIAHKKFAADYVSSPVTADF